MALDTVSRRAFWTVHHCLHLSRAPTPATSVAVLLDPSVVLVHTGPLELAILNFLLFIPARPAGTAIDLKQRKHLPRPEPGAGISRAELLAAGDRVLSALPHDLVA